MDYLRSVVKLYVEPKHHKEAIVWARLATSEIAKELSVRITNTIFIDVADANSQLATNPDWKLHTLSQRVEHLKPSESPQKARRRPPVATTWAMVNNEKLIKKKNDTRAKNEKKQKTPIALLLGSCGWRAYHILEQWITLEVSSVRIL
jgi:hypothetical protein